ncbi:MAG: hypothetical protein IPM93_23145 [Candidatus Obscuribacter sp.]|nr:hypothetical protein [Candidatus Obscuribacter sp.]
MGNALRVLDVDYMVTLDPAALEQAAGLILPGVGAFGDGMARLRQLGLVEVLGELVLRRKKPILGICLGMQLMAKTGLEHGCHQGLGWLDATVQGWMWSRWVCRLPHVGWNELSIAREGVLVGSEQQEATITLCIAIVWCLIFPKILWLLVLTGNRLQQLSSMKTFLARSFTLRKVRRMDSGYCGGLWGLQRRTATLGLESRLP